MKRDLVHRLGLLGLVSLASYTNPVVFSPLAYPGYDWLSQAVSDLRAATYRRRNLRERIAMVLTTSEGVMDSENDYDGKHHIIGNWKLNNLDLRSMDKSERHY